MNSASIAAGRVGVNATATSIRLGLAKLVFVLALFVVCLAALPSGAQDGPFAPGWDLDPTRSNLKFQSIKNATKVESSSFEAFSGGIEPDGQATVRVLLDSVNTLVDLRNVRMRFLFFETFKYPEATISLALTPDMVEDLPTLRRKTLTVPYTFDLHGVQKQMESAITVTLLTDDLISVASAAPISIGVEDFGLAENIIKLQAAVGGIVIVPSATVTFDFLFARRGTGSAPPPPAGTPEPAPVVSVALETQGDFSVEACRGRFEVLSATGNIFFRTASARLDEASDPLLASVVDIVRRCPSLVIEVSGHTDSDGSDATNQRLSELRARAVADYLAQNGIDAARIHAVGYGETRPAVANDSAYNKSRNRRIEFAIAGG
jgi:outer membrane protein OmpA-like peptidoglycan-associated protein